MKSRGGYRLRLKCIDNALGACRPDACFNTRLPTWSPEDVARAALGHDELGLRGIPLDLAPQPQNLNVDRAVIDLVVVHAARLEELISGENSFRRGEQRREQIEFAIRQSDMSPLFAPEAPRAQVELELGEPVGANLPLRAAAGVPRSWFAAARFGSAPKVPGD